MGNKQSSPGTPSAANNVASSGEYSEDKKVYYPADGGAASGSGSGAGTAGGFAAVQAA